jgi:small acid-soluble spore protein H (minor)
MMNAQRAKEIVESPETIPVTYNGEPIYIQHVDEKNETARIYPLNNPEDEKEVPVHTLKEGTDTQ